MAETFLKCRLGQHQRVGLAPTAVLAPVKSVNYLKQTLKYGFPESALDSTQPALRLTLDDSSQFSTLCYGRRLAILCLYANSVDDDATFNANIASYLTGEQQLDVLTSTQLLPMFVIEL